MNSKLGIFNGPKTVTSDPGDIFKWPIITGEDEEAVLDVLRRGGMSDTDVTEEFEKEFAKWQGTRYALGFNNGTAAIHSAMFGCKIGAGDEIICPSITYWASAVPVYSLGGTVVFADIDKNTLCINPEDIEQRITNRTKAIIVVHYIGYPADMDAIMDIANKYNIKVIEDVSHAQGGLYKGRKLGSIGHVSAMSLMSGKSFSIGEAGMLTTNDLEIYERAIAFGHYERFDERISTVDLRKYLGLPLGGYKYRMHQLSSAVGRIQLKYYDKRAEEIRRAMNYFWDLLDKVPGIRAHRIPYGSKSNMGGWYAPHGLYYNEELGGLSVTSFTAAVRAEGVDCCTAGCNKPLHLHPLFKSCDVYQHGMPTRIAHSKSDIREYDKSLPISEGIGAMTFVVPWFKHYYKDIIEEYAAAYRKVAENYEELLKDDKGNPEILGDWHFFKSK